MLSKNSTQQQTLRAGVDLERETPQKPPYSSMFHRKSDPLLLFSLIHIQANTLKQALEQLELMSFQGEFRDFLETIASKEHQKSHQSLFSFVWVPL